MPNWLKTKPWFIIAETKSKRKAQNENKTALLNCLSISVFLLFLHPSSVWHRYCSCFVIFRLVCFAPFLLPFRILHHSLASPSVSFLASFSSQPAHPVHFNLPAASPLCSIHTPVCIKTMSRASFVLPRNILFPVSVGKWTILWS